MSHKVSPQNLVKKQLFKLLFPMVHQTVPIYCWEDPKTPPIYKTNSGRYRLNILGAYDLKEAHRVYQRTEANCDATQVIEFLNSQLVFFRGISSTVFCFSSELYFGPTFKMIVM
ncbi:hypothetical protein WDW89_14275 [Deltaproteobacteria bacterium TL4]